MTTQTAPQPGARFWLSDALGMLGAYAGAYANNRLAYESARDEIELNTLRMEGYMHAAQVGTGGATGVTIPAQVAGVPTGVLMLGAVVALGLVIWAAKA